MVKKFLLSDESINRYGYRIITSGINTDSFKKNPVMLWNHLRCYDKNSPLPIGRWQNLRVENNCLYADAVFDEKDPFAKTIFDKIQDGFIFSCSISISNTYTSNDKSYIVYGQTRETIIKCDLLEVSICDIPANKNAVVLHMPTSSIDTYIPLLKQYKMSNLTNLLNLSKDALDSEVEDAIKKIISENSRLSGVENRAMDLELKMESENKARVERKADKYIRDGLFEAEKRDCLVSLMLKDAEKAERLFDSISEKTVSLSDLVVSNTKTVLDQLSWDELDFNGRLEELKKKDFSAFKNLYKSTFNTDYQQS